MRLIRCLPLVVFALVGAAAAPAAEPVPASSLLFRNVRVFDGVGPALSAPTDVLVRGRTIARIAPGQPAGDARVVDGRGRTLMPGLIDVHVHMTFSAMTMMAMMAPDLTPQAADAQAAQAAQAMLLRGFTSVRDMGGPIWSLKASIDAGKARGPRIWPSGPALSQTSGHGDFRLPHERSRRFFGKASRAEELGATFIVDGRDEVLSATRENLRFGAAQIKLMAGGGTSSDYDPLDVTQFTLDEMKAAVEAAADWGTYVTVHAYHPRSVRRAIDAGVKVIEHGQLLDEDTLRLMAERGIWLSGQVLMSDSPNMAQARRDKRVPVIEGQLRLWPMAKRLGVKLAWGTDFLFEPGLNAEQNNYILRLKPWFSAAEILKLITHDNAQLLSLSGLRSPYPGALGVVREGALADLILVDGNPLANIDLLGDPARNIQVIVKDGEVVKG